MTSIDAPASTDEARIRDLIEKRVPALAARDAGPLTSQYADRVVVFDAVGPLRHIGAAAHTRRVTEWLSAYRSGIDYTIRDLSVTSGADVAFCHYLYRVGGTMTDGTGVDMWLRSTVCLRKIDGEWAITHEHTSVPFDGATGAAALAVQPD